MDELSADNLRILNANHRVAVLVVGVQVLIVVAMAALSFKSVIRPGFGPDGQTVMSLWMGMLFLAGGSFLLRRLFNGWERLSNVAILKGVPGLVRRLVFNSVVTCLFGVFAAAIGLVISQLTGDVMDMMRAVAVSLVVFFANFPRKSVWKKIIARFQEQ